MLAADLAVDPLCELLSCFRLLRLDGESHPIYQQATPSVGWRKRSNP